MDARTPASTQPDQSEESAEQSLTPPSADKTLQWITVLSAAGMDYRLSHEKGKWQLHIPARQAPQALAEIHAFEADEHHPARLPQPEGAPPLPLARQQQATWTALWTTYALLLSYISLGSFDSASSLHMAAAMSRTPLFQGEWWRSITALTIHSGPPHLIANLVFLYFAGRAVMQELGHGFGLFLVLATGIAGNYMAAAVAPSYQRSVGASTACFSALGILCMIQAGQLYRRHHPWPHIWRRIGIPIAAGIALLGLTGTSPGSDIAAHLFGFSAGILLTIPFAFRKQGLPAVSASMQWALISITAALPLLAWYLAYLHA